MSNLPIIPDDKIQLVKDQICKGATDSELKLFIATANRTGLDPFSKQCWAVKRWDAGLGREVMSFQTGVDGFRVIAQRSDKYAGQLGPFWCGEDGVWKDVWLDSKPPMAAKVAVLRTDFKEPLWAVAKFSSYAAKKKDGSLTPFWAKMPELMIAKVAECLALRKAFPQDISGIYSDEEMEQASNLKDITPQQKQQDEINLITQSASVGALNSDKKPVVGTETAMTSQPQVNDKKQTEVVGDKPGQQVNPSQPPNLAPQSRIDSYKTTFSFGTFSPGKRFADLGVKDVENLVQGLKRYKFAQIEKKATVSPQIDEFLELAGLWLEREK